MRSDDERGDLTRGELIWWRLFFRWFIESWEERRGGRDEIRVWKQIGS